MNAEALKGQLGVHHKTRFLGDFDFSLIVRCIVWREIGLLSVPRLEILERSNCRCGVYGAERRPSARNVRANSANSVIGVKPWCFRIGRSAKFTPLCSLLRATCALPPSRWCLRASWASL